MSLYQRQDRRFGRSDLRADLAQLHLPGPSLVIDVRQGSNHPPLLWNLAGELNDLGTEMQQYGIYRWRYLTDCVDLLKLTLSQSQVTDNTALFKLATKPNQEKELIGMEKLIEELGKNHINRVRNNRIAAVRDREKEATNIRQSPTDPEHSTVRVFFLFDAEDQESMVCTGLLAALLKEWCHEYDLSTFPGREPRLKTYALCLSVDAYRHPSEELDYLEWAQYPAPALDAVILAHTYSDDEAYISPKLQSYQVELLLYILLLIPEDTTQMNHKLVTDLTINQNTLEDEDKGQILMPWPIYIAGISSLEYSTDHARRYVNKSQVVTTLQMLLDREEVNAQKKLGQIERAVQEKLAHWHEAVKTFVASSLSSFAPETQAVEDVVQGVSNSLPWSTKKALWLLCFDDNDKKISSLYTNTEKVSFERALNANLLFPLPTSKAFRQWLIDGSGNPGDVSTQQCLQLVYQATQMLAVLFGGTYGMVPRTQQQLTTLEAFIDTLRIIAEDRPDPQAWRQEFETQANPLRRQIQEKWPLFSRKRLRQGYKQQFHTLCDQVVRTHLDRVREIIAAKLALQLLEVTGLYTYNDNSPYRRAITKFEHELIQTQPDALEQQKKAYERAVIGLDEVEADITQGLRWLNLKSRRNILDWERIKALAFSENAYASLNLLTEYLLRLIGLQDPLPFLHQYLRTTNVPSALSTHTIPSQPPSFPLATIFTGVLLLLGIVDFDIGTLQTLLTKYDDLKKHLSGEELAILERAVWELQHAIDVAIEERNLHGHKQGVPAIKRVQSLVSVLEAWMDQQLGADPLFAELFERHDILTYLETNEVPPKQMLNDLRERNRVLGYRDAMNGEDHYYLLLPPGEAGDNFLRELDLQYSEEIHPIRFPDSSMLIFCHMHVSHYVTPSPNSRRWGDDWESDDKDKDKHNDKNKGNSNPQKGADSQDIINKAALTAAALAFVGTFIPTLDLLGMGAIWTKMTVDLAKNAEHEVNAELAKKALASLGTGVALYYAGSRLFTLAFHVIPGIGTWTAITINAILNWIYTRRLGKLLAREFAKPDFDPKMLLTPGLIAVGTILSLPHHSEVTDAIKAIDLHHLAAHAQTATDHATTAADAADHATTAADAADHTSTGADALHHASAPTDGSSSAAHHASTAPNPGLHSYSIDDLRQHGQRLLRSSGNTLKFGSRMDILLHAKGTTSLLNADHDVHVQIYQRAMPYLPQHMRLVVEEMIKGNTVSTKEHMTAVIQEILHSNIPRKVLREVLGDALKFGGGGTQNGA